MSSALGLSDLLIEDHRFVRMRALIYLVREARNRFLLLINVIRVAQTLYNSTFYLLINCTLNFFARVKRASQLLNGQTRACVSRGTRFNPETSNFEHEGVRDVVRMHSECSGSGTCHPFGSMTRDTFAKAKNRIVLHAYKHAVQR